MLKLPFQAKTKPGILVFPGVDQEMIVPATKLTLTMFENTIPQVAKINDHTVEFNCFTKELIKHHF